MERYIIFDTHMQVMKYILNKKAQLNFCYKQVENNQPLTNNVLLEFNSQKILFSQPWEFKISQSAIVRFKYNICKQGSLLILRTGVF